MTAVDPKKTWRSLYSAPREPELMTVPPRPYLLVDGAGAPGGPAYLAAVTSLYPVAYALRAAVKEATGTAYTVMPLEGLWWAEEIERFRELPRSAWLWTMMISLPDDVAAVPAADLVERTTAARDLPAPVRLEHFGDGEAAQVLHVGPYSAEAPTVDALHSFVEASGRELTGRHHEIYLSDPRRVAPERLRTIIRQPVTA
ncbi:GyrI-like domain-containing protein [Isoptericola sp. AK164]|uniref:GyrI-like domain-containing protein n=1 Tax=Isoptericola sp. AK164 TaxID=3024246 RepID=UPI002418B724|nr:GyrI-like domain-containing protein [Isoptericola sp. AK164]